MDNRLNKMCGRICAKYRKEVLKVTQKDVAKDLNYSQENISSFENGRNANNTIFLWYVRNGLLNHYSIEEIYEDKNYE